MHSGMGSVLFLLLRYLGGTQLSYQWLLRDAFSSTKCGTTAQSYVRTVMCSAPAALLAHNTVDTVKLHWCTTVHMCHAISLSISVITYFLYLWCKGALSFWASSN